MSTSPSLTVKERIFLLELARGAICEFARSGTEPRVDESQVTHAVREPLGCFVTLSKHGKLRGCIGNIVPSGPLFRAVMQNAVGSAFRDARFPTVASDEISELEIEISVLTEPVPLEFGSAAELLQKLRPGVDGVVLKGDGRTATFLPQVWEKIPVPADFLNQLALKARLPESGWRSGDVEVLTYQVESFAEGAG